MNLVITFVVFLSLIASVASGNVVLIGHNVTLSFDGIEANFSPAVKSSGKSGMLFMAQPIDACSTLANKVEPDDGSGSGSGSAFVLIVRGGCSFEDKVRRAQSTGFKAAIIYDNEDSGVLVAMAGNSAGIKIHAVFVSKATGDVLAQYAGLTDMELWIIPSFENSAWSIMAISFISLLAMSAVLATCFFVRRHRIRRARPRARSVHEFHGMGRRLVKAMPSLIFTTALEDMCTSGTCAICLEDYIPGEKLRVLPCRHKFHALCVDSWLTSWRTFCPVCKRDARTTTGIPPPASENTPLLSTPSSSIASSSFRSSSSAIQITSTPQSPSVSLPHSLSTNPYIHHSPSLTLSRSSIDLRNSYSQRSQAYLASSPHSLGYPSISPLNSRYRSPYLPSPSNASVSYIGSSSSQQRPNILRYSESNASFSPFTSAQSLPEC